MTAQLIEEDSDEVEHDLAMDLGRERVTAVGEAADYYPQIEHAFRAEAEGMAPHYEVFYSLERTIPNSELHRSAQPKSTTPRLRGSWSGWSVTTSTTPSGQHATLLEGTRNRRQ